MITEEQAKKWGGDDPARVTFAMRHKHRVNDPADLERISKHACIPAIGYPGFLCDEGELPAKKER